MQKLIKRHSDILFFLLVILLALPSILPLLSKGFPLTDDGNWMVIRFSAFYESLRFGQFPVRFLMRLNNGFGYPVADFLYPLFMYIGVPIHILGISFVNSVKAILIFSLISSSVFTYFWLRKILDKVASLVGAFFYLYFPYHLFDVYKRGSVGEVLSLAVLPFLLWQIERKSFLWIALSVAMLITAHNTLAFLFMVFIFFYLCLEIVISKDRKKSALWYFSSVAFGIGVSSFFWIPALLDLKYTVFASVKISDFSNYFASLGLIGIPTLFIIALVFIFILSGKIKIKNHRLTILMLALLIFSLFFSLNISSIFWKYLPVSFIQFPFRMLSLSVVCVSFLSAVFISFLKEKQKIIASAIFIIVLFIFSYSYLQVKSFQYYPDSFYSTNQDTTTVKNEYMPNWVKEIPVKNSLIKVQNLDGNEKVDLLSQSVNRINFQTNLTNNRIIQLNTIYFPGWRATNNGESVKISYSNTGGLIRLGLPKGQNNVVISFGETPLRIFADLISIISIVLVLFVSFTLKKKRYNLTK